MPKNYNLPIDNKILLEINDLYVNAKSEDKEIFWGDSCASAYEFSINNIQFKGRRDISKRWEKIENLNFSGKRILDVGSNIGIFGIFLLYFSNAEKVTFVEHNTDWCEIIRKLGIGLGLEDKFEIVNKDYNKINLEESLGYDYDLVMLLCSLKYFNDVYNAMDYFERFPLLLFEGGEESYETEFEDFFSYYRYNSQKISYEDNRSRLLYLFTKKEKPKFSHTRNMLSYHIASYKDTK